MKTKYESGAARRIFTKPTLMQRIKDNPPLAVALLLLAPFAALGAAEVLSIVIESVVLAIVTLIRWVLA